MRGAAGAGQCVSAVASSVGCMSDDAISNPALDTYVERADGMQAALDAISPDAWDRPSACEGWTGRDVVAHLVDTQRDFLLARGADLGERPDLADPAAAWRTHTAAVRAALARPGFADEPYETTLGTTTTVGETFGAFHGFDMLVHRWDATAADGRAYAFDDDALEQIEAFTARMGDVLYSSGACRPPLDVDPGADRQTRVLAALGRPADLA